MSSSLMTDGLPSIAAHFLSMQYTVHQRRLWYSKFEDLKASGNLLCRTLVTEIRRA